LSAMLDAVSPPNDDTFAVGAGRGVRPSASVASAPGLPPRIAAIARCSADGASPLAPGATALNDAAGDGDGAPVADADAVAVGRTAAAGASPTRTFPGTATDAAEGVSTGWSVAS